MGNKYIKIVVFTPTTHAGKIRRALGDAGAGKIGNYSHTSFSISGVGRFTPLENANPTIGKIGRTEQVNEERIETACHAKDINKIISAIKKIHPYEEVAIDIYPLLGIGMAYRKD